MQTFLASASGRGETFLNLSATLGAVVGATPAGRLGAFFLSRWSRVVVPQPCCIRQRLLPPRHRVTVASVCWVPAAIPTVPTTPCACLDKKMLGRFGVFSHVLSECPRKAAEIAGKIKKEIAFCSHRQRNMAQLLCWLCVQLSSGGQPCREEPSPRLDGNSPRGHLHRWLCWPKTRLKPHVELTIVNRKSKLATVYSHAAKESYCRSACLGVVVGTE